MVRTSLVHAELYGQHKLYGRIQEDNLAPGTYTISRSVLPFLENAAESMTVTSAVSDASNTSLKSASVRSRHNTSALRDFLGSAALIRDVRWSHLAAAKVGMRSEVAGLATAIFKVAWMLRHHANSDCGQSIETPTFSCRCLWLARLRMVAVMATGGVRALLA